MSAENFSITLPLAIAEQLYQHAEEQGLSPAALITQALEQFIQSQTPPTTPSRPIQQGDIYWLQGQNPTPNTSTIPHPYVVIQPNLLNNSRLETVVICALTSNIKRTSLPGNVLLMPHEANLPKQSVVEVSKVSSIPKTQLGDYIGTLSEQRIEEIFAGMRFLQRSSFLR